MGQRIIFLCCVENATARDSGVMVNAMERQLASSNIHELGSASGCRPVRLAAKAPAEGRTPLVPSYPRTLVHLFLCYLIPGSAIVDIGTVNYGTAENPLFRVLGNNIVVSAKPILESDTSTPNLHVGVVR